MSLAVVGVGHANRDKAKSNRRFEIALCVPGEPVDLRPEPKNPADERAIAVFGARGTQLGYLTAERCGRIGAMIREGRELQAVFQCEASFGAWIRVAFDGEVPVLPEPVPPDAQEPDFYPDEIWPDD
jgi:hypothetical protein